MTYNYPHIQEAQCSPSKQNMKAQWSGTIHKAQHNQISYTSVKILRYGKTEHAMHRESATRIQRGASQINRTGGTKIEHFQSTEEKNAVKSTSSPGCNCVTWKHILKL